MSTTVSSSSDRIVREVAVVRDVIIGLETLNVAHNSRTCRDGEDCRVPEIAAQPTGRRTLARPTLIDVARRAGLSPTAASLILNNKPSRLSADAAERVRSAARELGYRPNMAARSLRTKSQTIGFVSDFITLAGFGGQMIHGAMLEARKTGHVLLITETGQDPMVPQAIAEPGVEHLEPSDESAAINALLDRLPEGIVYATVRSQPVNVPEAARSVPLVLLNASSSGDPACSVLPDEYAGGRSMAGLLLDNAFSDGIALVGGSRTAAHDTASTPAVSRRIDGIFSVFDEHGVVPLAQIDCSIWDPQAGYTAVRTLIDARVPFSALLCLNDRLAFGAYQALAEAGMQVPGDVSVVSFDDDPLASFMRPQLTTVGLPFRKMGELAVQLLLDPNAEKREHLVTMPVQLRGSLRLRA